jgi:hypothetical protein
VVPGANTSYGTVRNRPVAMALTVPTTRWSAPWTAT